MNCTAEMSDNMKPEEVSVGRSDSLRIPKASVATTKISLTDPVTPTLSATTPGELSPGEELRMNAFGKVTGLLQKSLLASHDTTPMSYSDCEYTDSDRPASPDRPLNHKQSEATIRQQVFSRVNLARPTSPVKETKRVMLEFDPITKRKVLNTYEILGEIGRGEHGIVKLAKDLVNKELVAIKIVNRKSKKDRPRLRLRQDAKSNGESEYELKIRREIAIMKKCYHKHIVQLREVLDDLNSHKIYLVLEYLEKGEVKWKRSRRSFLKNIPAKVSESIPSCGTAHKHRQKVDEDEEDNLMSNEFLPNLTFKQSRKIFRDVVLGLEYLHLQGIVHRDIKPANLLVSSDNVVKISDFGVSFASSLDDVDQGLVNELELAKTAGTPAFFAPELCQTNFSSSRKNSKSASQSSLEVLKNDLTLTKVLPKIDYKIDIWALGVTFYCLLFGKLPFNADSEFELFAVIVNHPLEFPKDKDSFNSPTEITEEEFDLAKDLLSKLLDKNSTTRIEIKEIKEHPFVLMDLENDLDSLNELLYLNDTGDSNFLSILNLEDDKVTKKEVDNAVVGIGTRIKRSIFRAITSGSNSHDIRRRFFANMERSTSLGSSSDESSVGAFGSSTNLGMAAGADHSVILSEGFQQYSSVTNSPANMSRTTSQQAENIAPLPNPPPFPSINGQSSNIPRSSSYPLAGIREGRISNPVLQDVIDANVSTSRRGSASANEVETKRNVGGDLYLHNQSLVDTFKGLQQLDDKRRRSSTYSSLHSSNSQMAKNSVSLPSGEAPSPSQPMNIPGTVSQPGSNQIRVGPISNDRRESSVISIPLSASFASLDSVNDDYLSYKYHEYNTKRKHHKHSEGNDTPQGATKEAPTTATTEKITEKFAKFNLDNSMKRQGITFNITNSRDAHEGIAPKTITGTRSTGTSESSCSSCSSDSVSRSPMQKRVASSIGSNSEDDSDSDCNSDSNESDDSEEDGNLTLAFSSRVQPSRPQFLSLKNRAKSHDSSLSNIQNHTVIPVVYANDGADIEELPEGLMDKIPRPSIAAVPLSVTQNFSTSSTATTITTGMGMSSSSMKADDTIVLDQELHKRVNSQRKPSPLVNNAPSSAYSSTNSGQIKPDLTNRQYNNHYKKEPFSYPFPKAIHNETGKETAAKSLIKEEIRPAYYRSNSITLGILQAKYDNK